MTIHLHLETKNECIRFSFVHHWNCDEIQSLYESAGWWDFPLDNTIIHHIISGSYLFCVAVNKDGIAIGMGRILSDGISIGFIHDVYVMEIYQGLGIGSKLIQILIQSYLTDCRHHLILVAEPGTFPFYERQGFVSSKNTMFMQIQSGVQ